MTKKPKVSGCHAYKPPAVQYVFVERGSGGKVKGIYTNEQEGYAAERLRVTHKDVVRYNKEVETKMKALTK